ncbi:glycogen synthase [Lutibacter sp.]|uniref:glycogen synthase n=1 Tax=Lutibacter sp. TaxID=1925666 RepID=UPI00273541D6|nr:glycogen/starch synthase [Lutibacter sp.]MDP3311905.1 glycogen/starch synthase [Lutibacter sp.]
MKIYHVSAECYPIAKVGGLADVVGSLPKYQKSSTIVSQVVMPFYNNDFRRNNKFSVLHESKITIGDSDFECRILTLKNNNLGFDLFLVDVPKLLFKDFVYSNNDTIRFLAFQIGFLDWMLTQNEKPSIIHCHDHHTGLIPFMMTQSYKYQSLKNIPTVLTIHNAQYQGWFSHDIINVIPEFNFAKVGLLDWGGVINPLAAAIKCAWRVTTVSPSYMEELKIKANGLENLLNHESKKCVGILNGIDTEVWNPENDSYIVKNYKSSTIQSGKKTNKKWLCKHFNLDEKKPMVAFIGRLVGEKGSDLFPVSFRNILKEKSCTILLLGSGHKEIEDELKALKPNFIREYNVFIGYDEKLSHIIYAGADFLLMPSRVEPCGLNQMYSLRYGTVPIVRNVGGLKDTITDIDQIGGFGICHERTTVQQIVDAVGRSIKLFNDDPKFKKIRKKIMSIDHSWSASANEYIKLYKSLK